MRIKTLYSPELRGNCWEANVWISRKINELKLRGYYELDRKVSRQRIVVRMKTYKEEP